MAPRSSTGDLALARFQTQAADRRGRKQAEGGSKTSEDRSRVRTGAAPQILAGVRNLIMNWLRARKIGNIAQALRENAWNPQRLSAMLGKQNQ